MNPYYVIDVTEPKIKAARNGRRWLAPFLMIIVFGVCLVGFIPHLLYWVCRKDPPMYLPQFFDWCDKIVLGDIQ